jgi:hypothetical protein
VNIGQLIHDVDEFLTSTSLQIKNRLGSIARGAKEVIGAGGRRSPCRSKEYGRVT